MIRLGNGTPVGPYRIQRFIKDSLLNSCYVVDDGKDGRYFLKLFDPQAIPAEWLEGGEVREIVISRGLDNGQVTSYVADGTLTVDGVAAELGGGGHPQAAGISMDGSLEETTRLVVRKMKASLEPDA